MISFYFCKLESHFLNESLWNLFWAQIFVIWRISADFAVTCSIQWNWDSAETLLKQKTVLGAHQRNPCADPSKQIFQSRKVTLGGEPAPVFLLPFMSMLVHKHVCKEDNVLLLLPARRWLHLCWSCCSFWFDLLWSLMFWSAQMKTSAHKQGASHSCARLLFTVCGSSQPTMSACQTVLMWWQEAGTERPVLFLQYSWQREAAGRVYLSALCRVWRVWAGGPTAGIRCRVHVDTTHDPHPSKTSLPLGRSGHLFGSEGLSRRCVGLGSGRTVCARGWKCGKVGDWGRGPTGQEIYIRRDVLKITETIQIWKCKQRSYMRFVFAWLNSLLILGYFYTTLYSPFLALFHTSIAEAMSYGTTSGSVSCLKAFWHVTTRASDQTANLSFKRWPTLPPSCISTLQPQQ